MINIKGLVLMKAGVVNYVCPPAKNQRAIILPGAKFCSDCGELLTNLPPSFKGKNPLCKSCLEDRRLMQHYCVSSKAELYDILNSQPVYDESEESFVKSLDIDTLANYLLCKQEGPQPEDDDLDG